MEKPLFFAAVFGIFRDSDGRILFQKRANTGYRDGYYQLPSGHVEEYEGIQSAIIRECKEEINADVLSLELKHITQWINPKGREYFNGYFEILTYSGEIKNLERDKCSELYWAEEKEINENNLFSKDREILHFIKNGVHFSETFPGKNEFKS